MVGCAKRDAQKSLTLAQQAKEEAQNGQAPGYVPKVFDDANSLLNLAQSQFDSGDYKQSKETAERAQARFLNAVEQVPRVRQMVQGLLTQIDEALDPAEANIQKARDANVLTPEEINPIADQVTAFRQNRDTTIDQIVVEEELNNYLAQIQELLAQTESLSMAHLKPQAATAREEIDQLITNAQELKAETHVADQFAEVLNQYKELESAERDGKWQSVIDIASRIKEPLNRIITAAQEKAAGDILNALADQINQAKLLNVQIESFTSAVTRAEESLQTGRQELQSQQYANAIAASNAAESALAEAYQSLGTESQAFLEAAKKNLDDAISREAEQYAPTVLAQAREAIASVEELLQNEQYTAAYTTASQAKQISEKAILAARRGKAQAALATVEKPFSVLHTQGGSEYVPQAYQAALSEVQKLRDLIKTGEFESVVSGVPAAEAVVKQGREALAKAASDYIVKSVAALEDAQTAKAPDWVRTQYDNAVNLKSAAGNELEKQRYLSAIRNAESSIKAARDAEARAYQLQTEQNLRNANKLIVLAKRAEQDVLSPLAYNQAIKGRDQALDLAQKRQFKQAYHSSVEAVNKSEIALNNLILTARAKTDSALEAKAMSYSQPEITQAIAHLNEAEEAQQAENFSVANGKAQESAKLAEQAEHFTWKQRSYKLLRKLEGTKEELESNLAMEKTPSLYRQAMTNLTEAKVEQINENYKGSYQFADAAAKNKEQIRQSMKDGLGQSLTELKQTADWLGENALDEGGREIKIALMDIAVELERQIDLEDWLKAYAVEEQAKQETEKATAKLQGYNRKILVSRLQEKLQPYAQQDALYIIPEQAEQFEDTLLSLSKPELGETYGDAVDKYQASVETVESLPDDIMTMATQRTEEVAAVLQRAQQAGTTKYFKEWYRTLSSDLQWLRNAIRGNDYKGISSRLKKLEKEAEQLRLATLNAIAEDDYLEKLSLNLEQMKNLIDDFGFLGEMIREILITGQLTEHKIDPNLPNMYRSLQGKISVRTFRTNAELLEERVKDIQPPKSLASLHKKAITSFEHFRKATEGFETYGKDGDYDLKYRNRAVYNAYDHLYKVLEINEDLQFVFEKNRRMSPREKFNWNMRRLEDKMGEFYYSWSR